MALRRVSALQRIASEDKTSEIFELGYDPAELGKPGSFRYNVLVFVLEEKYDQAIDVLRRFLNQASPFPNFVQRMERYIEHAIDLVYAIKTKRNFPGLASLTRAKQQELRMKFLEHFDELKFTIRKVERVESDLSNVDAKATVYLVRGIWVCLLAFFVFYFARDMLGSMAGAFYLVISHFVETLS